MYQLFLLALMLITMQSPAMAVDTVKPLKDERLVVSFAYQFELLDEALKRSVPKYGPYIVQPYTEPMAAARDQRESASGKRINVLIGEAGVIPTFDEQMIRVPIALDKGLHGTRIAFIMKDMQEKLDSIKTLEDLRNFTVVQGSSWGDVKIYEYNKVPIETAVKFESLLLMLQRGRADLFPRGANEVTEEFAAYARRYPGMVIEQHMIIKYPFPQYFFVSKTAPRVAERITFGLREMIKDGSFDAIFNKHFAKVINELKLGQRTVIHLENPLLPADAQVDGQEQWFEPKKLHSP